MKTISIETNYIVHNNEGTEIARTAKTSFVEFNSQQELQSALDMHTEKVGAIERKLLTNND